MLRFATISALALMFGGCVYHAPSGVSLENASSLSAPTVKGVSYENKTYDLSQMLKKGPVILYFINYTCPCNIEAAPYVNQLYKAYGNSVQFIGVANADKKTAQTWAKENKAEFPILLDPNYKIIKDYQAPSSPTLILVSSDQQIVTKWCGYSKSTFEDMNSTIAKHIRTEPAKLNLENASERLQCGCPFDVKNEGNTECPTTSGE